MKYISNKDNFYILLNESNKVIFKEIIEEYNNKFSYIRKQLISRRNNWQFHISKLILQKEKFIEKISINTKECLSLIDFAQRTVFRIYNFFSDNNLIIKSFNQYNEIE